MTYLPNHNVRTATAEYENYDETSHTYDTTRSPVGLEVILGCFAASLRPLAAQTVLDGGCGTGNYLVALEEKVQAIHGLDLNPNMLEQARKKVCRETAAHLRQGSLESLPYADAMFDGMVCNQVAHHLEAGEGTEQFPHLRRVVEEAYRVLRPGGVFILNTSTRQQVREGFWWAGLIPEAVDKIARRLPPLDLLQSMLDEVGFGPAGIIVPIHEVLQGNKYLDPSGPFRKAYRDGDSTWSLATPAELEHGLARLRAMHEDGSMTAYLEQCENRRHQIGQTTSVFARKEGQPASKDFAASAGLRDEQISYQ